MKPSGKPGSWSLRKLEAPEEFRRDLQLQLSTMTRSVQWALLPVITLALSALWDHMDRPALLLWFFLASAMALFSIRNMRINRRKLNAISRADPLFNRRNVLNYYLVGVVWGSLPVFCVQWGDTEASWIGLIISLAMLSVLVLILSSSIILFLASLIPLITLVLTGILLSQLPRGDLVMLTLVYAALLLILHNCLFHMQVDRVRSILTNAKQALALARTLELHDPLTGLYNHAGFIDWLRQQAGPEEEDAQVLLALGNVAGFTELNALFGTQVADAVLREIASRLSHASGGRIGIARLGGAEFLLADFHGESEPEHLLRMFAALENEPYAAEGQSVAIGMQQVWVKGSIRDSNTLIEHARNRLRSLGTDTDRLAQLSLKNRRALVAAFGQALAEGQIHAWFQPIVDCRSNAIVGWEALARWQHPEHGLILPDDFLPIARVSRQLSLLSRTMLQASARYVRELRKRGLDGMARVHLNLVASELGNPDTLTWMEAVMREGGLAPGDLIIELTERDALIVDEQLAANLRRMDEIGLHLAIDDFGTGYSNLGQLLDLPAHAIKIDKRFIEKLPGDKDSAALVRAVITLAAGLGMQAIAEGVEYPEQIRFLRDCGCDAWQGFYTAPALPPEQALELAVNWERRAEAPSDAFANS